MKTLNSIGDTGVETQAPIPEMPVTPPVPETMPTPQIPETPPVPQQPVTIPGKQPIPADPPTRIPPKELFKSFPLIDVSCRLYGSR